MADRLITLAQGLMGVNQPEPTDFQTPQDFGQADYWHRLGEMLGLAPAIVAPMMAIKAYHGSPHDFSSFDLSKIGTGEGAQAYGHGLYFAENPEVAGGYRKALTERRGTSKLVVDGKEMGFRDAAILAFGEAPGHALTDYTGQISKLDDQTTLLGLKDALEKKGHSAQVRTTGGTYEVNIHASPDELLDWDKPLSQQPPKVREKVLSAIGATKPVVEQSKINPNNWLIKVGDEVIGGSNTKAQAEANAAAYLKSFQDDLEHHSFTGEAVYRRLGYGGAKIGGRTSPEAAQKLKDAGIKGIQYLDQGSRAAGEGTKNFVIFDDKIIEIAKKYGLALPAAASLYKWQQSQKGVE